MGKGKTFVQEYEANSSEIRKQYEKNFLGDNVKHQNTNKTPKKKKRKK